MPNGIPSHDTFNRVFARLNPEQLEKCFSDWVKSISSLLSGEHIAIDGKTLRHSYDHNQGQKAIVMVSAWARNSGLILAPRKVTKKSNEITAIPELLKVLELCGAIVSLDAMGCQKEIVNQIASQKADYLITLKKNQGGLYQRVDELFKEVLSQSKLEEHAKIYTVEESGHGRNENRRYQVLNNISELVDSAQEWSHLNSVVRVEYLRQLNNGNIKRESRYFITSLSKLETKFIQSILPPQFFIPHNQLDGLLDYFRQLHH